MRELYKSILQLKRMTALLLCAGLLLSVFPASVGAADVHTVTFVNYDLSSLDEASFSNVPQGARLYTAEELEAEGVAFSPAAGCTWYLYYPGGGEIPTYGPVEIHDPPMREGYQFRDWVAQGASDDSIYTVTGDTTFVARYISEGQYVLNLYFQFDNASNTVAAETATTPYGLGDTISMQLPMLESLAGLTPHIVAASSEEAVQASVAALNQMLKTDGTFSGELDDAFLQHCRTAGFVAWDSTSNDFQKDQNGNVQIDIPITYTLTAAVAFTVEYWLQDAASPNQYTKYGQASGITEGTTRVNLNELNLVESYVGFTLTSASAEDAASYTINADGTSVIKLYYDRNTHYIYYQMNGGNAVDPVPLRYGQTIPETIGEEHLRAGYVFEDWIWRDQSGTVLEEIPTEMPDSDLTLEAVWKGTDTTVTLVYWLENANDTGYTVAGQQTISVMSGQSVGYEAEDGVSAVDVPINDYLTPEMMTAAGISDGEFFTFSYADSSTQWAVGQEGGPKTAAGDGSTVINLGYTRNQYTLVFHLGRINGSTHQVATSTGSNTSDPNNWQSGHSWSKVNVDPTLTIGGQQYYIDNDVCYEITAKYGAYISDQWPVATDETVTEARYDAEWWELYNNATYYLFTWGTHYTSQYYATHSNKNIIGVYPTMSAELIIDPQNPEVVHHLVGYWSKSNATKTHHYMFEAVPGADATDIHSMSEYSSYWQVATQGNGGWSAVQGLEFYEYSSTQVRTTNTSAQQNAPAFANVTYRYGCYSGDDVYFFYTYNDYTVTYHENNANLIDGEPASEQTVGFHYLANMTLAEELAGFGFDYDYVPDRPYVSTYGNAYTFDGWYTDANLTFPVDWEEENPVSSINLYAKWTAPTFTLTLIVPGGTLYDDSLAQFEAKGYTYTVSTEMTPDGEVTTVYTVSGIPGGTKASEIVQERHGAKSNHSLAFDYWGYTVNGDEQRYLFDESQLVTADLTLTARWKTEYTGQYTVRYLTEEPQDNGLGTVLIDRKIYYRLQKDKTVSGVVVGSSVTEEAQPVEGYLSQAGDLTRVVEAPDSAGIRTYFDFFYSKVTASVTYYVHYVRDTGIDYGRDAPPDSIIRLAEDKVVTVDAASLNESTNVSEASLVIGGYTPRDGWNTTFTLSARESQNHLYLYYVSNSLMVDFQAVFHIQAPDGHYPTDAVFTLNAQDALGKVLYGADLAEHYGVYLEDSQELDALLQGHTLDEALTTPFLLLTRQEENNVIHVYMKNCVYTMTYQLQGSASAPTTWTDHDIFLTEGSDGSWFQAVTFPNGASAPTTTPTRPTYRFTAWNTAPDGSGTSYSPSALQDAPWYQPGGMQRDVVLYAQWESQLTVDFDLRGGVWMDTSGNFQNVGSEDEPVWRAYVDEGGRCLPPSDPVCVLSDGTAYSFIGWTAVRPEEWQFVDEEKRVDLTAFEAYRFDFGKEITQSTTLYAVWDPDVTNVSVQKTDTDQLPLAGAEFTLERLQATVSGSPETGYTYELKIDDSGAYLRDDTFVVRTITSDNDGMGELAHLPAGYYRLTETRAPVGYQGLSDPVILYIPYGGEPQIFAPTDHPYVTGMLENGDLTVAVQNISQYSFTIAAPSSLTLSYQSPNWIWNPETLQYEAPDDSEERWQILAPDGEDAVITVTNTSPNASVEVEVSLQYTSDFQTLLPLSTLTGPDEFPETGDDSEKRRQGTLAQNGSASFTLELNGNLPADAALPPKETEAGGVTVRITPMSD